MDDRVWLRGKKVLFVEDDEFFAGIISAKLTAMGCVSTNVANGADTFVALKKEKPDLMILDIMLPGGMDGFAILKKMKDDPELKDIPVIILSNLGRAEDIEKGMQLGAYQYLAKARVTPTEVIKNLEVALGSGGVV